MKENNVQPNLNVHKPASNTAQTGEPDLRQQRMDELLENIQQSVLQQIIGPFGLTHAMFNERELRTDFKEGKEYEQHNKSVKEYNKHLEKQFTLFPDKDGGNVTTQHNAEKKIFAKEEEKYNREDYDYSQAKKEMTEEFYDKGELNSQQFKDAYTGEWVDSKRARNSDGKLVKNFEFDHTISLEETHRKGGWMQDKDKRKETASNKENLNVTSHKNNRKKSNQSAQEALSEENGYDQEIVKPLIEKAEKSIEEKLPSTMDRVKYHAKEIGIEGAKNALNTAMQQALGALLFEFSSGVIAELKRIFRERNQGEGIIKRIAQAIKRIGLRLLGKFKSVLGAALHGGIAGFLHTLVTFAINNFVTTAKKLVTILREGVKGLWQAIKLMVNPPKDMPAMEVARQVSKIFIATATTATGMFLESTLHYMLSTIPLLIPFIDILSPVLMGIATGVVAALLVYSVDRLFDWLSSTGTEKLQAMEKQLFAYADTGEKMFQSLDLQIDIQHNYVSMGQSYQRSSDGLSHASRSQQETLQLQYSAIRELSAANARLRTTLREINSTETEVIDFLEKYRN